MFFLPLGITSSDSTVADSNAAPLSLEDPNALPVSVIAAYRRANVKPLDYVPPTPLLSGEGGTVQVISGFRIHSYTGTGGSSWTLSVTTPFDPFA
jgi:hypothetical protein